MHMNTTRALAFAGLLLASTACSHQNRMKPVVAAYATGDYAVATLELTPLLEDRRESEKDRTLYELEAGAVYMAAGDLEKAGAALDAADERMWEYLDDAPEIRVSEQAAAILTNQTIITYYGRTHDRIMCSTYKGLNHLLASDLEKAGVSFRRAQEWQKDAYDKNAAEIEELEKKSDEAAQSQGYDTKRAMEDPRTKQGFDSAYGPLREMRGYGDFEVPYSTFLRGLRFQLAGGASELEQATGCFRRIAGMLPEADREPVLADAQAAEAAMGGTRIPPTVYVLLESGMAPWLDELRIDIPLFLQSVPYVGAAFPLLKFTEGAPVGMRIRAGGQESGAILLTDMDRVVAEDFNRRLPGIITVTLVSSATKAIATYLAQEAASQQNSNAALLIAIGGAIYQVSTNSADLRTWLTLPKHVYYARIPAPADGVVEIELGDGQKVGPIQVESTGPTIVHLRAPKIGVPPVVRSVRFPGAA
jgi:hypothetical protein